MKKIKHIVYKKGTDVIFDFEMWGLQSARELLGFNEDNINEVIQKHSQVYLKVRMQETQANFRCDNKDLEVGALKDECDFVLEEVSLKIREGEYPMDIKVTDKSVLTVAKTSKEYKQARNNHLEAKRQLIQLKRNKSYIHDMVKALEHKKDLLISGSANYRAELEHEIGNLRRKVKE
jgi:hypothetical protein